MVLSYEDSQTRFWFSKQKGPGSPSFTYPSLAEREAIWSDQGMLGCLRHRHGRAPFLDLPFAYLYLYVRLPSCSYVTGDVRGFLGLIPASMSGAEIVTTSGELVSEQFQCIPQT